MKIPKLKKIMNNFIYSGAGLKLTENFEGLKLVAYQDQRGIWTIGYGHTAGVYKGMICTEEQAAVWLQQDILWASSVVNRLVTVELTQSEFDALTDFTFNLGSGNFQESTLLKYLNAGNYTGAAEQFPVWDLCAGQVDPGLKNRRLGEQQLFNQNKVIS